MADWLEAFDGPLFRAEHLIEVATASTDAYGKTAVFAWVYPDGRRRRVSDPDSPIQTSKLHALIKRGLAGPEPLVSVGELHGGLRLDLQRRVQRARPPATPLNAYDPGHPRYNPDAKHAGDFLPVPPPPPPDPSTNPGKTTVIG